MEILKDAASAAIYGAEAGNGVILITTKTGGRGKTQVTFDAQWTYSSLANKVDLMNAEQYTQFFTEVGQDAFTSLYSQYNIAGTDTDWQDEMYETGEMQKYNLAVQGGNDMGNFFVSMGYMKNDGMVVLDKDRYERITGQINASYKIKPWLEVGTNNTITVADYSTISENSTMTGLMREIIMADPLTPVYYDSNNLPERVQYAIDNDLQPMQDSDGRYFGYSYLDNMNPLGDIYYSNPDNRSFYINGMTYLNLTPFKNFVFTSRLGYTLRNLSEQSYSPSYWNSYFEDVLSEMSLSSEQTTYRYYQWENFLNYTLETQTAGDFSIMVGMSYSHGETNVVGASTDELSSSASNFVYLDYSTSGASDSVSGDLTFNKKIAYFGRLGWDYQGRYNAQFNFRADAYDSAYLDLSNSWGYFPSASIGWTFSSEEFMENVVGNFFTYGKFRASYGVNGSISNLGNYMYTATLKSGANGSANMAYWLNGQLYQGIYPDDTLANEDLRWERSKQVDLGLDLRFLNSRLSATLEYYYKLTDGLLVESVAQLTTGTGSVYQNLGKVVNKGVEVELEWKDRIGNFSYGIKGNIATVSNNVKEYKGEGNRIAGSGLLNSNVDLTFFEEGYPLWYIRGYKFIGVDSSTGEPIYQDTNGDGDITADDRVYLGSGIPDFTYGLTLSASYKNFDIIVYGTGSSGSQLVYGMLPTIDDYSNRPTFLYENRWTESNTSASLPSAIYQINDERFYNSDAFVFDASYFKIKQIQLGYTLPKSALSYLHLDNLRAYVSLDNFFTFTDYPGSDPEINASSNTSSAMALDYGGYPLSKSVSFGFNVAF